VAVGAGVEELVPMGKIIKVPTGAEHTFILNRVRLRFSTAVEEEVRLVFSTKVKREPELVFSTKVKAASAAS
jgi:hypothetical protein